MENIQNMRNICKCSHHKFVPFLVVLFGVTFFMGFWGIISWDIVNLVWPVVIILAGMAMVIDRGGMCKCAANGNCCGCGCC